MVRMPWIGKFFAFNLQTIEASAPSAPGIYVLWTHGRWIYVGETNNLRMRLVALVGGDNACISNELPTDFGFELIPTREQRAKRREALIRELVPICLC